MSVDLDKLAGLDNEAPLMKNYKIHFTAIIKGSVYVAAQSKDEARRLFDNDSAHAFDSLDEFGRYKITKVEEIG